MQAGIHSCIHMVQNHEFPPFTGIDDFIYRLDIKLTEINNLVCRSSLGLMALP